MDIKAILQTALQKNNYQFTPELEDQFVLFLNLLQQWNRVFNLTAIRDPKDMVMLHILDSLSINPYLHGNRIVDIGTGAGLPGIPLALLNPDKQFALLDSNSKKTRFIIQALSELKIKNVDVIHSRCEEFHPEKSFDTIVSRAFSSLNEMVAGTRHLLAPEGQFLAMKGVYPTQEIAEIPEDVKVLAVHPLQINGLNAERCLVCLSL